LYGKIKRKLAAVKGNTMKKGYIYAPQMTLFGNKEIIGFGTDDFYVKEMKRVEANKIIIKNHYSGKVYSATYIHLGVYAEGGLLGVMQFGYAMNPASMASVVSGTGIKEYLELNRMWFKDGLFKNIKSQSMALAIKFIKGKHRNIKWIQSFADERCNKYGIVYQACNFLYCGEHKATFWELSGTWYHNSLMTRNPKLSKSAAYIQKHKDKAKPEVLRQFRYLYFIKRNEIKNLLLNIEPPPKHYAVEQS
jgi:hypothetical protein